MLIGKQIGLEDRLGLRKHRADGAEHLAEGHLVHRQAALGGQRRLGELPLFGIAQEQVGDRPGQRDAALEDLQRIGGRVQVHPMAVLDRAVQPGRQVPGLHEPAADRGMVEPAGVSSRAPRARHDRAGGIRCRGTGRAPPGRAPACPHPAAAPRGISPRPSAGAMASASARAAVAATSARRQYRGWSMPFGLPLRSDLTSEKLKREGQGGVQAEHHQRLAQILALAALRIQRANWRCAAPCSTAPNPCSTPWQPCPSRSPDRGQAR